MKNYVLLLGVVVLGMLGIMGCQADKEGINEKAAIEGRAVSESAITAENNNLAARAKAMEIDLEKRRRFIDSVVGTYEGVVADKEGNEMPLRLMITSSYPRQPGSNRSRSIEELSYELSSLYINAQVVEWSMTNDKTEMAFGCVFEQVRPNIVEGTIHLMSKDCKISYSFFATELVSNIQSPLSTRIDKEMSRALALNIVDDKLREIQAFIGRKQSNLSSKRVPLHVKKVDNQ